MAPSHTAQPPAGAATGAAQQSAAGEQPSSPPRVLPAQKRERESLLPTRGNKSWMNIPKPRQSWLPFESPYLPSANVGNHSSPKTTTTQASAAKADKPKVDKKPAVAANKAAATNDKASGDDKSDQKVGGKKKRVVGTPISSPISSPGQVEKRTDTNEVAKVAKQADTEANKENVQQLDEQRPAKKQKLNDEQSKQTRSANPVGEELNTTKENTDIMSFDRQQAAFLGSMSAAAAKLGPGAGTKRSLAPPSPSPSIGSTTSAAAAGSLTPRRDRDAPAAGIVYSQPALTGTGDSIISQMAYAVSWLRSKDEPQGCTDVLGYLSANTRSEKEQEFFVDQMRRHPQIQWIPDPALSEQTWKSGTYVHRPTIPNVKTKTQLLAHLQRKTDASGVSVKDLKDGWPDCEGAINELEKEHKLLVVRAKKDGAARMVWMDDPSLFHEVDPQLKIMWSRTDVPSVENIVPRLLAAQLKPASEDPRVKASQAPKVEKKKKKAQRRTGKSTNTHMEHLLKDYSHMKR